MVLTNERFRLKVGD